MNTLKIAKDNAEQDIANTALPQNLNTKRLKLLNQDAL